MEDIYEKHIEEHRYEIVNSINCCAYADQMRENRVMSEDDIELVMSKPTRRSKTGQFLLVLFTYHTLNTCKVSSG